MNEIGTGFTIRLRRIVVAAVAATIAATLALIVTALIVPGRTALALHWYLLVIGAVVVVAAIRAMTLRYPVQQQSLFDAVGRPPVAQLELPARLRQIDRLVVRAGWDPAAFQFELRPLLRAIAAQRLATYRTIDIDAEPAAARAALSERAWTFLAPSDLATARGDGGIDRGDLRAAVETLEKLDVVTHT
jgi:hypothetical protein